MKTLNTLTSSEPILINWYTPDLNSRNAMLLVGGYGDDRNYYKKIISLLLSKGFWDHVFTFSFRGLETKKSYSLNQQIKDLKEVVGYLINDLGIDKIRIVLTSDGAYSTYFLLNSSKYGSCITDVLMLDPADYFIDQGNDPQINFIWSGYTKFHPDKDLASDRLKNLKSDVKIHIVHFILRNYGKEGYIEKNPKSRGLDQDSGFPRLNSKMVRSIYKKIPRQNKGDYIDDPLLPHAFERDGNVVENRKRVVSLIMKYLNRNSS